MLQVKSIDKRLGDLALQDISFDISDGGYFVLLGPSGAGKTVLLEMIAGLLQPDRGQILWNGRDIVGEPPQRRRFAVVYQDYALFPHLTVRGNIRYGIRARGDGRPDGSSLDPLIEMLGIRPLLDRYPHSLSGGEQQRVALARALATRPHLLLLDEPLSALETTMRLHLRKELKRINRQLGIAVLHITHDPEEALALADTITVLLDGQIRQTGTPEVLFRRPSDPRVAAFLGMRNILPVTRVEGCVCQVGDASFHVSAAGPDVRHIWIKPEEIVLSQTPFRSSARNQFRCTVVGWEPAGPLLAVEMEVMKVRLTAVITHASFQQLEIQKGSTLYATFKSSAVHCL